MAKKKKRKPAADDEHVLPAPAMPASELGNYSVNPDPDLERDIAQYVEGQTRGDEVVQHVERIKSEHVLGTRYEIWDVTTDKDRYWVIDPATNLYPHSYFPSMDYTLSFHIGLVSRMRARSPLPSSFDPDPFDDVFRRQSQVHERHDAAVEAEDYQAVGVQLRETLISLIGVVRRRLELGKESEHPQDANFVDWADLLLNKLCPGRKNKQLRQYLKTTAKETWQLVNWLAHDRDADRQASGIAIHACDTTVGHFIQVLVRERTGAIEQCPRCSSRQIRSHFDPLIEPDGEYYTTCGVCGWSSHPHEQAR
jgi:hypothetical protein